MNNLFSAVAHLSDELESYADTMTLRHLALQLGRLVKNQTERMDKLAPAAPSKVKAEVARLLALRDCAKFIEIMLSPDGSTETSRAAVLGEIDLLKRIAQTRGQRAELARLALQEIRDALDDTAKENEAA